jgi:hypothetical protein
MRVRLTKNYQLIITPDTEVEEIALVAWLEKRKGDGFLVESLPVCYGYHSGPFVKDEHGHSICEACHKDITADIVITWSKEET